MFDGLKVEQEFIEGLLTDLHKDKAKFEYEILALDRRIEVFNTTNKPLDPKSKKPNVCMVYVQQMQQTPMGPQPQAVQVPAAQRRNSVAESLKDVEIQIAAAETRLSKIVSSSKDV